MAIDYPVRRPTRRCAATDRALAAGEAFVSVLVDQDGEIVRRDYASAAWTEPPDGAIGWWRCRTPERGGEEPAPREVLLGLLDEWADQPEQASARYLLALLLVRRRVLRNETGGFLAGFRDDGHDEPTGVLKLVGKDRDEPIEVAVAPPSPDETPLVQQKLSELLGAA